MSRAKSEKNPGPSWGYRFINAVDRILPSALMNPILGISSFFAMLVMKKQRQHSRLFLSVALGRPATIIDCWRRFSAFSHFLVQRFRAANGQEPDFVLSDHAEDRVETLAKNNEQALYGTFHFGNSDLLGFWLSRFGITLRMVREQVGNSDDLRWLEKRFGKKVGFIYVNNPGDMLFALKKAIEDGHSVAMKCDRVEHSSKLEAFEFMGAKRLFPFTIYHLAILFQLPVAFAIGVPQAGDSTTIYSSTVYRPTPKDKKSSMADARIHFQDTLRILEKCVLKAPHLWFNFLTENPIVKEAS